MSLIEWLSPTVSLIAVITALSKLFQLRTAIELQMKELDHKVVMMSELSAHQDEFLKVSLNQVREVADHIRSRTRMESKVFEARLLDLESYLEKTTSFVRRHH